MYKVNLKIESTQKYNDYLRSITFNWAGVSNNIAYHFSYLEYLYQLQYFIPLSGYQFLDGLRIKTIITEIASCAEVLLYDSVINLTVSDNWDNSTKLNLDPKVGFFVLLEYAFQHKIINKSLKGRLHKLFDLRHKIHLTHGTRDPDNFNTKLLKDQEKTLEDLIMHFLKERKRNVSTVPDIDINDIPFPWNIVNT